MQATSCTSGSAFMAGNFFLSCTDNALFAKERIGLNMRVPVEMQTVHQKGKPEPYNRQQNNNQGRNKQFYHT